MDQVEFSQEDLRKYAIENAAGIWYTTILFLNSKGVNLEEWVEYVGKQYAPGWKEFKGKGSLTIAREAALNWISCGATLVSLDGDDSRAEAVLTWPPKDYAGVSIQEAHKINNVFLPIAQQVGLKCYWQSEGKQFRLTFCKDNSSIEK